MLAQLLANELTRQLVPWSVLISTALLAWAVGALDRRFPNPIIISLWFLGLATAAWLGEWGAGTINLGLVFLALPHVSLALLTRSKSSEAAASDETVTRHEPATASEAVRISSDQAREEPAQREAA